MNIHKMQTFTARKGDKVKTTEKLKPKADTSRMIT